MASETEICNQAISHLGIGKEIADLDTEASAEASACRRFYDLCRDTVLRDFDWPFASNFFTLGLIEEDPNTEWDYSYRYPSNCLKIIRILSGKRQETTTSKEPYKIARDTTGRLIYADKEDACIEYTEKVTNPGHYTPDFTLALSYRLAVFISPRVMQGDPFKLGSAAMQMYQMEISKAKTLALNEAQTDIKQDSEFIQTR